MECPTGVRIAERRGRVCRCEGGDGGHPAGSVWRRLSARSASRSALREGASVFTRSQAVAATPKMLTTGRRYRGYRPARRVPRSQNGGDGLPIPRRIIPSLRDMARLSSGCRRVGGVNLILHQYRRDCSLAGFCLVGWHPCLKQHETGFPPVPFALLAFGGGHACTFSNFSTFTTRDIARVYPILDICSGVSRSAIFAKVRKNEASGRPWL